LCKGFFYHRRFYHKLDKKVVKKYTESNNFNKTISLKKLYILIPLFIILLVAGFAVLTKTGAIPNYLELEVLCPIEEDSSEYAPSWNGDPLIIEMKPVIYLYPEEETNVSLTIDYPGELFVTYPKYEGGWEVVASPNGKLLNIRDGREYSYLFWEGRNKESVQYDMTKGYVVTGNETATFLQDTLEQRGLTPAEYNEFIVYWLPQMIENKYNLIHFATEDEYHNRIRLNISPEPDSVLRIFMVFKALEENNIDITPQSFEPFSRDGFTVVEWGGTELKD